MAKRGRKPKPPVPRREGERESKQCTKCLKSKAIEEFYAIKNRPSVRKPGTVAGRPRIELHRSSRCIWCQRTTELARSKVKAKTGNGEAFYAALAQAEAQAVAQEGVAGKTVDQLTRMEAELSARLDVVRAAIVAKWREARRTNRNNLTTNPQPE